MNRVRGGRAYSGGGVAGITVVIDTTSSSSSFGDTSKSNLVGLVVGRRRCGRKNLNNYQGETIKVTIYSLV